MSIATLNSGTTPKSNFADSMTEYNQSFEPTFENKMKMITGHYAVPADLQPYIDSFWYVENSGPETETSPWQYCLATGLVEIIIHIRPPYTHTGLMSGKRVDFPVSFLGGIHVEPVLFQMKGGCGMFGISCKPEMFLTLFNMPIGALADYFTDLRSIFGKSGDELTERIQDAPSHENRVQEAVNFFRKRAASPAQQDRYYFSEAMQYIRMGIGQHSVDDLCGKVFVGKRQLQRVFQENIGISPKVYGRIIRFKNAYDYVRHHPEATWTEISHHFGYSDQSHFIRDFRAFTGENPTAFLSCFAPQVYTPLATTA